LGLIPVAAVLLTLAVMLGLGLKGQYAFNPPYLLVILTFVFYLLVTPIISLISARGYLATGSLTLLFVSLAFFVGMPFSVATAIAVSSPSLTVTFGALGLLISSTFQILGAAQASFGSVPVGSERRNLRLTAAYSATLALSVLIVLLGSLSVFPAFFVQNVGATLIDEFVYVLIILFFVTGGLLYLRLYIKSKSETLFIYSLALLLYSMGSFGLTKQVVFGDAIVWIGRLSTYFGLLYFLYALLGNRQKK